MEEESLNDGSELLVSTAIFSRFFRPVLNSLPQFRSHYTASHVKKRYYLHFTVLRISTLI